MPIGSNGQTGSASVQQADFWLCCRSPPIYPIQITRSASLSRAWQRLRLASLRLRRVCCFPPWKHLQQEVTTPMQLIVSRWLTL